MKPGDDVAASAKTRKENSKANIKPMHGEPHTHDTMPSCTPDTDSRGHLPRLAPEAYRGLAMVHWSMSLDGRFAGWLDDTSHAWMRELALHTAVRYDLLIPAYCAMPDHLHLLAVGTSSASDQKQGMAFLRRHLNDLLATRYRARLQRQSYDNVLREQDRERGAFQKVAFYVLENPVRKGLVASANQWPSSGCIVPGHPGWNVFHSDYWDCFWREYATRHDGGGRKPAR